MGVITRCSDACPEEPLPGTAKTFATVYALEYPEPWGRDVLDGSTLGAELTGPVKAALAQRGAALQLLRRVGRRGHGGAPSDGSGLFHLFVHDAAAGVTEVHKVAGPEVLVDPPELGTGALICHPQLYVCTHGRRDACCAIKGRPLAAAADARLPEEWVWECSHVKGHRFAAAALLMPWGYSYGRLEAKAAAEVVMAAARGRLVVAGNRGRGCWSGADQVAELAVAGLLSAAGEGVSPGMLRVAGGTVRHPDGRAWEVRAERRVVPGVVASCGEGPKDGKSWQVTSIVPREAGG